MRTDQPIVTSCLCDEFVAWIDLMYTSQIFTRSSITPITFIINFLQRIPESSLNIYPMNDGIFITSKDKEIFLETIKIIFDEAVQSVLSSKPQFQCILRGAVAYGEVFHGKDYVEKYKENHETRNGNNEIIDTQVTNEEFVDKLVLGEAIRNAYILERDAPPFGILFDDEAKKEFSDENDFFRDKLYLWFKSCNSFLASKEKFERKIKDFYLKGTWDLKEEKVEKHLFDFLKMISN